MMEELTESIFSNNTYQIRCCIILNQLPDQYKAAKTNNEFKMKIKS